MTRQKFPADSAVSKLLTSICTNLRFWEYPHYPSGKQILDFFNFIEIKFYWNYSVFALLGCLQHLQQQMTNLAIRKIIVEMTRVKKTMTSNWKYWIVLSLWTGLIPLYTFGCLMVCSSHQTALSNGCSWMFDTGTLWVFGDIKLVINQSEYAITSLLSFEI